jgi:hypothetical protein
LYNRVHSLAASGAAFPTFRVMEHGVWVNVVWVLVITPLAFGLGLLFGRSARPRQSPTTHGPSRLPQQSGQPRQAQQAAEQAPRQAQQAAEQAQTATQSAPTRPAASAEMMQEIWLTEFRVEAGNLLLFNIQDIWVHAPCDMAGGRQGYIFIMP